MGLSNLKSLNNMLNVSQLRNAETSTKTQLARLDGWKCHHVVRESED